MNGIEGSPMVASESFSSRIPVFAKAGKSKTLSKMASPKKGIPSPHIRIRHLDLIKPSLNKYLKSSAFSGGSCKCCHVLVADDDTFQHFFYQNLFQKSMDFEQIDIKQAEFRADLCLSGEELIDKYHLMKNCGCRKLRMVITDYYMGEKKFTGYETAKTIREAGFEGPLLLRTSEKKILCILIWRR